MYCYEGLLKAYKTKLEIDSVTAFLKGKVVDKPEIFSPGIIRRLKLMDEEISKHFMAQGLVLQKSIDEEYDE
jgi:hypothetical protein